MKDAYYFPHDANARNDPKILAMRSVYGCAGYGWFWIIVEMLREQADYRLPLDRYISNALAMQMQCDADAAHKFVQDCINEFHLFESDGEYFWSNSLINRMSKYNHRSAQARAAAQVRWQKQKSDNSNADAVQTQCDRTCDSNASKVKYSRVKYSRVDHIYTPEFESFWTTYPRRIEKQKAFKCWNTRLQEGHKPEDLIRAASHYADYCKRKGTSSDYIKHPATFLGTNKPFVDWLQNEGSELNGRSNSAEVGTRKPSKWDEFVIG